MRAKDSSDFPIHQGVDSSRLPASVVTIPAWVTARAGRRLIVILRAPGCTYDLRPSGGCQYCGFRRLTTDGTPVSADDLVAQFSWATRQVELGTGGIQELDVFNSGSFLNDLEITPVARLQIAREASNLLGLRLMVVESRPEYVTTESLTSLHAALSAHVQLEVAIGLDAYSDHLRQRVLQKGITRRAFEAAVHNLAITSTSLLCYVMLKPWSMSDERALHDAVRCAEYAHEVATRFRTPCRIGLEPTFVVPGTPLAARYKAGLYAPPSLWLAKSALEQIARLGPVHVGMWDEDLKPLAVPDGCAKCGSSLRHRLTRFNLTQDPVVLAAESCECARLLFARTREN
jgi:hypothetical protein